MKHLVFISALFIISLSVSAQSKAFEERISRTDSISLNDPREKIFIHYDKPYYKLRDTMWLKGYILSAAANIPNDSSRIVYIEIFDAQNELVKRISSICNWGMFTSDITLHENLFKQGEYIIRAYTNRLRNFGDSFFYKSSFKIINPKAEEWKVKIHKLSFSNNRLILSAGLATESRQQPADRMINVKLQAKNKNLFGTRAITDATGNIYIDTLLKDIDAKNLLLELADKENLKVQLPVKENADRLIDLQFLPEGGTFIAEKKQQLGFKAVNVFGKGVEVRGVIKDSKGSEVVKFETLHKGMGIVSFTPKANDVYTAFLQNGLSFKLPSPQVSGTLLQVVNSPGADSVTLKIDGSPDLYGRFIYFTVTARGITAARGRIRIGKAFELNIHKKQFPSGIVLFTLYDENLLPVNERAVFIWHQDDLKLSLTSHQQGYQKKDSVSLQLKVKNKQGENIAGSFSFAVLDTSQAKVPADAENLLSYMILSSDLKGNIEEPYYYFRHPESAAAEALMLTQGWVSYKREMKPPVFPYEKEYQLTGRVSNIFNGAVKNTKITLFGKAGKNNIIILDTTTNDQGGFTFKNFPVFDTDSVSMIIKALNKRGKAFNLGVDLNQPDYPAYSNENGMSASQNMLTDTIVKQYISQQEKIIAELKKDGTYLEEVIVRSKLKIPGSKNLNKDGGADQVINESTLDKTPKETLLDVLKTQVKGFRAGTPPRSTMMRYMINSNLVRFIIDGMDINVFYQPSPGSSMDYLLYLDSYLKYFNAEDIRGIEIMNMPRHNSTYRSEYLSIAEQLSSGPATIDYSFVEITTRTGEGPFLKKTPGVYLVKPLYPFVSKQFYSPAYSSPEQKNSLPDFRSTIYWNPSVITNERGEAAVSFYTSESNSSYVIIVQGTDLRGGLGVLRQPLTVTGSSNK